MVFLLAEEILRRFSKEYRIPLDKLREKTERTWNESGGLLNYEESLNFARDYFVEEFRQRMREKSKERARIPDVSSGRSALSIKLTQSFFNEHNSSSFDFSDTVSLYDADWEGFASQAIINRYCDFWPQERPLSHYIVYHRREAAVNFVKEKRPEKILFVGYEPHGELQEMLGTGVDSALILGTHIRPDMRKLADNDKRISYFNSMDYELGERPLTFILWHALEGGFADFYGASQLGRFTALPAILGCAGYGWSALGRDIAKKAGVHYNIDAIKKITGGFMRLVALDHANAANVVTALSNATGFESPQIKKLLKHKQKQIKTKYEETVQKAIDNYKVIGDVVILPVYGWESPKPFSFKMRSLARDMKRDLAIIVDYHDPDVRKISIRTAYVDDDRFDVAKLLEDTFAKLPQEIERNHGAHKTSGGAVFPSSYTSLVLSQLLLTHFSQTDQKDAINSLNENKLYF
ncbi:MAG TPA: hypothetical protein VJJ76_03745 [archaeon]|nr:hypothetical protein [archaeon]